MGVISWFLMDLILCLSKLVKILPYKITLIDVSFLVTRNFKSRKHSLTEMMEIETKHLIVLTSGHGHLDSRKQLGNFSATTAQKLHPTSEFCWGANDIFTLYILFAPCRYSPGTLRAATEENCICNPEWPFACIGIFSLDQCEWYNIHRMMECFVLYLLCQGFGEKVVYLHMKLDTLWVEKYMMMRFRYFFFENFSFHCY